MWNFVSLKSPELNEGCSTDCQGKITELYFSTEHGEPYLKEIHPEKQNQSTQSTHPQRREYGLVELGVLAHPAVAVVDVARVHVAVRHFGQHAEPLLKEVRPEKDKFSSR